MKTLLIIAGFALSSGLSPALAQSLTYSNDHTASCLEAGSSLQEKKACIGVSANACMEDSVGGFTTVAMGGCLNKELNWWDKRLNVAYNARMKGDKADDAQNLADAMNAPSKAKALRAMQRAWMSYRDTSCDYARAQFGGGTGGGPAAIGCLLTMTAEQTLTLEAGPEQ